MSSVAFHTKWRVGAVRNGGIAHGVHYQRMLFTLLESLSSPTAGSGCVAGPDRRCDQGPVWTFPVSVVAAVPLATDATEVALGVRVFDVSSTGDACVTSAQIDSTMGFLPGYCTLRRFVAISNTCSGEQ